MSNSYDIRASSHLENEEMRRDRHREVRNQVLEILRKQQEPMKCTELAKAMGLQCGPLARILRTFPRYFMVDGHSFQTTMVQLHPHLVQA